MTDAEKDAYERLGTFRDELKNDIADLRKKREDIRKQWDALATKFGPIAALYQFNIARIAAIDKRLAELDKTNLTNAEQSEKDQLIGEKAGLTANNAVLKPVVDQLLKDIADLKSMFESLEYQIYRLERKLAEVEGSMRAIADNAAAGNTQELLPPSWVFDRNKCNGPNQSIDDVIRDEDRAANKPTRPGTPPTQPTP